MSDDICHTPLSFNMSHQERDFYADKQAVYASLNRSVDNNGRFAPHHTAEQVADQLSGEIVGKVVVITGASPSGRLFCKSYHTPNVDGL